jgi:hypothetical protein
MVAVFFLYMCTRTHILCVHTYIKMYGILFTAFVVAISLIAIIFILYYFNVMDLGIGFPIMCGMQILLASCTMFTIYKINSISDDNNKIPEYRIPIKKIHKKSVFYRGVRS